jgi:hypothetical protein
MHGSPLEKILILTVNLLDMAKVAIGQGSGRNPQDVTVDL